MTRQKERIVIRIILAIVFLIALVLLLPKFSGQPTVTNDAPIVKEPQLIRPYSPTLGPSNAKVTVVEFLDPESPGSAIAHSALKVILNEFGSEVKIVVRYFPLYINSLLAIRATEAAGEQGKYWEMQDLLFNKQAEWGNSSAFQTEKFKTYAEELGLNIEQFNTTFEKSDYSSKIRQDHDDAVAFKVSDTPVFFINGQRLGNLTPDGLRKFIKEQLEQS